MAIIVLSISLLTSSSFAISLTPPQVYAVKEEKTISNQKEVEETCKIPQYMARFFSITLVLTGFVLADLSVMNLSDKELSSSNRGEAQMGLAGGIGMMVLGGFGIYWSF
ncbi:MAG: hypothetical protein IKS96_01320 [Fibrobacter sp.]|nr:hypothetical protein [Fibrobacter sp.]